MFDFDTTVPEQTRALIAGGATISVAFDYEQCGFVVTVNGNRIGAVNLHDVEDYGFKSAFRRRFECIHPGCKRIVQDAFDRRCVALGRRGVFSICDAHADEYADWSTGKQESLSNEAQRREIA